MTSIQFRVIAAVLMTILMISAGCTELGIGNDEPATLDASDFQTHQSALQEAGSATIIMNFTVPSQDQSVQLNGVTWADFENNRATANMTIPLFGGISISQYYDGTTTYERTVSNLAGTEYNATAGDGTYMELALLNESDTDTEPDNSSIDISSEDTNLTFERVDEEGVDGATVFEANQTELVDAYAGDVNGSLVNATMEIHRTDDGIFNYIHLRLVTEVNGERQLTELKLRLTNIGNTDVTKPEWVETAALVAGNNSTST